MSTRFKCLLAVAVCHLGLVAMGAASVRIPLREMWIGRAVSWYTAVSGADGTFRFFSPSVGSSVRASFTLTDAQGATWNDELYEGNGEVQLRLIKILLGVFDPELRRPLTASWAGKLFGRHPTAQRVVIQVETQIIPTMANYTAGQRPRWVPEYCVEFARSRP